VQLCVASRATRYFILHFQLQATIFDFSLTPTHGSVQVSPVLLPDLETIGIAVGMSLLSCLQAEIYVISYPHPVSSRHL